MNRRTFLGAGMLGLTAGFAGISISDRTTERAPYSPLGRLAVEGAKEVVLNEDGSVAYLAVTDGFAIVDLSDPTNPTLLATNHNVFADHENGPLRRVWDVSYDEDRLVVASQAGATDALYAFVVFDVSDPAIPQRVLTREVAGPIHNCDIHRDHVYITGSHPRHHDTTATAARLPVEIYDIGDAARKVTDWSPLDANDTWGSVPAGNRTIHDVRVVGDRAYLAYWDAGAFVLDVADPADPTLLARVGDFTPEDLAEMSPEALRAERTEGPTGNVHYVSSSPDGSVLAVGKEAWDGPDTAGGGPGGIDLYSLSDPRNPRYRATIDPEPAADETRDGVWTTAHNFEITEDRLYSAWYRGGLKIHDISDPARPERLAWWLQPSELSFWTAQLGTSGEFFVASSSWDGSGGVPTSQEALVTFPDRPGEQPNRPSLGPAPESSTATERERTRTPTQSPPTGVPKHPPSEDSPAQGTRSDGAMSTATQTETSSGEPAVPGGTLAGGALAALAGVGVYQYLRGR